jgi:hypothetical protein
MCDPITIGAVSLVSSVGMGIYSGQQQAAQASASMRMQQQNAQSNIVMSNQQQAQQVMQQRAQMAMQQQQQQLQMQQSMQQNFQNQMMQQRQQADGLAQQQRLAYDQQRLNLQQTQTAQRLQIDQAAESRNLQIEQMNNALKDRYTQQREAVRQERDQLMLQNQTDRRVYQDSVETSEEQKRANAEAANRVYVAEQQQLSEKRKEAAFQAQTILAKSIGAKGSILATGRTGQSVGLLALDTERQAGVATAQQEAMLQADYDSALIAMDDAFRKNQEGNRQAEAKVGFNPEMPYLPSMPEVPNFVGFEIPK